MCGLALGNLNQVVRALGRTIRAMADASVDSQVGSRICNGLGWMKWKGLKAEPMVTRAVIDRLSGGIDELAEQ
jgi:hypothetical protein